MGSYFEFTRPRVLQRVSVIDDVAGFQMFFQPRNNVRTINVKGRRRTVPLLARFVRSNSRFQTRHGGRHLPTIERLLMT